MAKTPVSSSTSARDLALLGVETGVLYRHSRPTWRELNHPSILPAPLPHPSLADWQSQTNARRSLLAIRAQAGLHHLPRR